MLPSFIVNCRKLEHPLYVFFGFLDNAYDFSLLRLESTIDLTRFPNVRPVCWPSVDPGVGQQVTCQLEGKKIHISFLRRLRM